MYWIKNHYLDIKLETVGDWLVHPHMMIRKDKVTLNIKQKKRAPEQDLPDNFSERLTEFLQAKDKFPVLKRVLTQSGEFLYNLDTLDTELVWELTTLDNSTQEVTRWVNPFLLGWLLYHLGVREKKGKNLDDYIWMLSLQEHVLYLLEGEEICAVLTFIRKFDEDGNGDGEDE